MIKKFDVYYVVMLSEICDPHFRPSPDKRLRGRYETEEDAQKAADKWEEENPEVWAKAWVKEIMRKVVD